MKKLKVRLHYTSWEETPQRFQNLLIQLTGKDKNFSKSFYELYFYWYNIAHEMGHCLRKYHGARSENRWVEEMAANDFAVTYWRTRGETEKLSALEKILRENIKSLPNPVPSGEDQKTYFTRRYSELTKDPLAYGYFQFNMVLRALEKELDFYDVLKELITAKAKLSTSPIIPSIYKEVKIDLPRKIVKDMGELLAYYNVEMPDIEIVCKFSPGIQFVEYISD